MCVEVSTSSVEHATACMSAHCDFDHAVAQRCLDDVAEASCNRIADGTAYAACAEVWTACDGDEAECWEGL